MYRKDCKKSCIFIILLVTRLTLANFNVKDGKMNQQIKLIIIANLIFIGFCLLTTFPLWINNIYKKKYLKLFMSFWDKVKAVFIKQKEQDEKPQEKIIDNSYNPNAPLCWACNNPIYNNKIKRLNGKKCHTKCFRQLKKIALKGSSIDDFSGS
jgi:hypothetical protein